ncbi:MAG: dTDP-glucose 4,6-dehydratase [Blastocatellia bacterium]|nr:dTDP-glucose 4,6-dehydratase [Blastocatellia bacterium]
MLLITGGAGFIGSNFVVDWLSAQEEPVVVVDALTYAGCVQNLASVSSKDALVFIEGDVCDRPLIASLCAQYQPRAILHFAAESHVDRSIHGPGEFVRTNVTGTFELLEAARAYWTKINESERLSFRFLHVSTDEVYGALGDGDAPFTESSAYAPNSPYAATKAASDHLVRAYFHTYGLPTLTTNCSNNFGPYQFPEKLIPILILNALEERPLPVYGDGSNVRDWLFVTDHCRGVATVLDHGVVGETYNIGARCEKSNLDIARTVCSMLDELVPRGSGCYADLITFVADRPGHDRRYAINPGKIESNLKWRPLESFESALRKTIVWYLKNIPWVNEVRDRDWNDLHYGAELKAAAGQ